MNSETIIKLSPYLNIFTEKVCTNIIPEDELAYTFPYELDAFQKEGIYRIYKNENILITAHTGSGKTVLAIYAIAHCLKHNKKVLYTSPTKSLSNQKYSEFTDKFGKDGSVGIMTGDIKMNPNAQCVIMTTEILRNILYKDSSKSSESSLIDIKDVGAVIFDEVHYINDPDRGKVWEESIVLLPKDITLVMLSATIDKPEILCSWIGNIKEKNISLIPTTHRVVPLRHHFWKSYPYIDSHGKDCVKWELLEILDDKGKFKNYDIMKKNYKIHDANKLMDNLVDYLVESQNIPALFFKFSRKKCETICKTIRRNLLTFEEISQVEHTFDFYMKNYKKTYEILPQYQDVYSQLKKGVVYHHSGLIPILKEIIEILYGKGLVKILIATETFAIGINSSTKTVIFSDLEKYDNNGLRDLRTDEYLQCAGRGGRRGYDEFGTIIILPTMSLPLELTLKSMMTGKSPSINSKFKLSYQFVLKTLASNEFDLDRFLSKTLIMNENDKIVKSIINDQISLEKNIETIKLSEDDLQMMQKYDNLNKRLTDTFFVVKKKEKEKMEKEKKTYEAIANFKDINQKFNKLTMYNEEYKRNNNYILSCNNSLKDDIKTIITLLEKEEYILDNILTKKGTVASCINECNELVFTEIIFQGVLDNLEFPEIMCILVSLLCEKDSSGNTLYISDLNVPKNVITALNKVKNIGEYLMNKEDDIKLNIGTDYNLYLDFIEQVYIWSSGGSINDIYQKTTVNEGNFVKCIMRLNNMCENLMDICKKNQIYVLCSKLEGYSQILIRGITNINSLYVQ
jgi:superfamily II RNA helicase